MNWSYGFNSVEVIIIHNFNIRIVKNAAHEILSELLSPRRSMGASWIVCGIEKLVSIARLLELVATFQHHCLNKRL